VLAHHLRYRNPGIAFRQYRNNQPGAIRNEPRTTVWRTCRRGFEGYEHTDYGKGAEYNSVGCRCVCIVRSAGRNAVVAESYRSSVCRDPCQPPPADVASL